MKTNMNNTPIIRISKGHRSCNCCCAQNYNSTGSPTFRKVDDIYEIVVGHMVNAVCPECLQALVEQTEILLNSKKPHFPADADVIRIQMRDCNGYRSNLEFPSRDFALEWAEVGMSESDEILVITQGNICLYSSLQADPTMALTRDDIAGFFA